MQNQNFQQFNDTANQWRIKVKPKVSQKKKKKKKKSNELPYSFYKKPATNK